MCRCSANLTRNMRQQQETKYLQRRNKVQHNSPMVLIYVLSILSNIYLHDITYFVLWTLIYIRKKSQIFNNIIIQSLQSVWFQFFPNAALPLCLWRWTAATLSHGLICLRLVVYKAAGKDGPSWDNGSVGCRAEQMQVSWSKIKAAAERPSCCSQWEPTVDNQQSCRKTIVAACFQPWFQQLFSVNKNLLNSVSTNCSAPHGRQAQLERNITFRKSRDAYFFESLRVDANDANANITVR